MNNFTFNSTRWSSENSIRPYSRLLFFLLPLLLLLSSSNTSLAAYISGKSPVCINDTANYEIGFPTAGVTYKWVSVSGHGIGTGFGTPVLNVQWIANGTGSIHAIGVDGSGTTVETLNKSVVVLPKPIPFITTNYRVACQTLTGKGGDQPEPVKIIDTSICLMVCSGASVTYYAHGEAGSTFDWAATGHSAIYPMGDSCIVVWGSPGRGTVKIIETNTNGCVGSLTFCFEIIERPLAHFQTFAIFTDNTNATSHSITICLNDYVIFKDISTASASSPIMNSYWDFGDGKYLSTASPTSSLHKYTAPGVYTAMLVEKNACGCTDTARIQVTVRPEAGAYITCPAVVCEGAIAGYKVHDYVSCPFFNWSVIGGTIISTGALTDSITVKWDNVDESGFGYVMFDATGCGAACNGSVIVKVPVIQNKGKINGPKVICVGEPAIYRLPQWPTTRFNWNESSGTATLDPTDQWNEIVVTASVPGTIILRANYRNTMLGCGGVAYDTIEVLDKLDVLSLGRYCQGTNYIWSLSNPLAVGDWTLIAPDMSILTLSASNTFMSMLTQTGPYKLYVEGAFCNIDTIHFTVTPKPPSVDSLLGPDKACPGVPTKYEAKNNLAGYTFGWIAETGSVSPPSSNITWASFSGAGPWEIKVWRSDALGCPSDTLRKAVGSPIVPVHITGPLFVCGSSFHDYEVDYLEGETYDWEIWDNTYSTTYIGSVTKPTDSSHIGVTWNNPVPGPSEIAHLIVKVRKCGVYMIDTIDVEVNNSPTVTISGPTSICSGEVAVFTASSTPSITSADYYNWDWEDFTTDGSAYPVESHTYNTLGASGTTSYKVTLTIGAPNGCASTVTAIHNITVNPQPILTVGDVNSDPLNHCGMSTWTNELGLLAATTATSYIWSKDGVGVISTSLPPLNIDETVWGTGVYTVVGTDAVTGCSTTAHIFVTDSCNPCTTTTMPTVSLSGSLTACAELSATGSWTPSGWGYNPYWKYDYTIGDTYDVTTTSTTFTSKYRTPGVKRITYMVKYLSGSDTCEVGDEITLTVPYVAGLRRSFYCVGGTAHVLRIFDYTLTYATTPLREFYVDGIFHSSTSTSGTFFDVSGLTPGSTHSVLLVVSSPGLPTCSTSISVTVPSTVVASFYINKYNPACVNDAVVEFMNTSPGAEPIWKAHWDFGDGANNDRWQPWRVYGSLLPSNFKNVVLTITDIYGCTATTSTIVDVKAKLIKGRIDASSSLACSGSPITLTYNPTPGPSMPTIFSWYEQITFLETNTSSTRNVYTPGGYWVWGKDAYGCNDKTPVTTVNFNTVPEAIIAGDISACDGVDYNLYYPAAAYPASATYTWLENGIPIIGTPNMVFNNVAGTYTYRLVISITLLSVPCHDTSDPYIVTVYPTPAAPVLSFAVLDCEKYEVQLSATSASAGVFNWSTGDVGTPILVYSGGPYRAWITDAHGCVNHDDITVPHKPELYTWIFPVGCYELCENQAPFTLLAPKPPATFNRWDWLKNGSSDLGGGPGSALDYNLMTAGTYNLALDNGWCADTSDDLNISFKYCPDGCFGNVEILGWQKITTPPPTCYDSVLLRLTFPPSPTGITWVITTDNGTIIGGSGSGTVAPPPTWYRYIADKGFAGPVDFLTVIFTDPATGITCRARIPFPIGTPCANSTAKMGQPGADVSGNTQIIENEFAQLLLSPNPANRSVRIQYGFTGKANQRSIELFDMAGRRIANHVVLDTSGEVLFDLDGLSSGLYQVILRQDGNVFLHSKLSVLK